MIEIANGKIQRKILVIDFDLTLLTQNDPREIIEKNIHKYLKEASSNDILLFISSRNPPYIVQDILKVFNLSEFFKKIFVDYRPKAYHIKQILWELEKEKIIPKYVVFIDDFLDNCQIVSKLRGKIPTKIFSIRFSEYPNNLENIIKLMIKDNLKALEELTI